MEDACGDHGRMMLRDSSVIIVNNFDRVSCPAWFDSPRYAGFDNSLDSGVPYIRDISYIGEMYQIRRDMPWTDDDNPGFGASYSDFAGGTVAGNTFDYPYVHGKAVMRAGYPFYSVSADAFENDPALSEAAWSADIICGKQVTTMIGRGAVPDRYSIFPIRMQEAISGFTESGGNILISGANIGTDVWDRVFPVRCDSTFRASSVEFIQKTLGYRWVRQHIQGGFSGIYSEDPGIQVGMRQREQVSADLACPGIPVWIPHGRRHPHNVSRQQAQPAHCARMRQREGLPVVH